MGKWFIKFQALIWAASLAFATVAYAYGTFATTQYVDSKHEGVMDILREIRQDVRDLRSSK